MVQRSPFGTCGPVVLALAFLVVGCAPAAAPSRREGDQQAAPRPVKTLTIAMDNEPNLILTGSGSRIPYTLRNAVHRHLATFDHRGDVLPELALELPSQAKGTWVVRPDGTMQTVYRLHTNVTWHDGAPLTSRDFAFGWTVSNDPDLPIENRIVARQVARVDTPDDHTVVIEWAHTYASANAIVDDDLGPIPVHLLKSSYDSDKEQFWRSPYWTREFVGVGPYRLVEWQPGSAVTLEAYDGFYSGRARIDRIIIEFVPSRDTIFAHVLAGTVDWGALPFEQAAHLKQEWERAGLKPTAIVETGSWRYVSVQFRDPAFRELLDIRVRRGLLHALDRQALADGLFEGLAPVSDTFIPPDDFRWDWVKDVTVRYPNDLRRAEDLLAEAGWRRGADRAYVNAAGERVVFPLWTNPGAYFPEEAAITSDQWKTFGILTEQRALTNAEALSGDRRVQASFPALYHNTMPTQNVESYGLRLHSASCPSEQNHWVGSNYGCFSSPRVDQIIDRLKAAIDPNDQRPLYGELTRLYTEELPLLPLYFMVGITVARPGITGVKGRSTAPAGNATWNITEWDIE